MWPTLSAPQELDQLLQSLARPSALTELAVLIAVLAVAWLVVRLLKGPRVHVGSVWFGLRIVDGVLFPVVALALAYAARHALRSAAVPEAVFRIAVPVLLSLLIIRLAARVFAATYPGRPWALAVERTVSWFAWGAVVLWITGLLPAVLTEMEGIRWKVGSSTLDLRSALEGLMTAGVVLVLALWVSAAIERKLLDGTVEDLSLRKIAANLARALLLFVGLLLALSAAGIDLTALSVLGGALGVGLGFGLQKLAANYVSGFVILAERSLRIGDMVKVDGFEGRVTDINTRYTVIRALNGRESIVPNEMLITQRVENSSLSDPRVGLGTAVLVPYGTDLDALMPRLLEAVRAVPRVLAEPGPGIDLAQFAPDGLELTIGFWVGDPAIGGGVRSAVNLAVLRTLDEAGIDIPSPRRVISVTPEAVPFGPRATAAPAPDARSG